MAIVGVLSTQLVYDQLIRRQPPAGPPVPLRTEVDLLTEVGTSVSSTSGG